MSDLEQLVHTLVKRRHELKMSQRELGVRLDTTQPTIARWEGLVIDPPAASLCRWASALGLTLALLWTEPVHHEPPPTQHPKPRHPLRF